MLCRMGNVKCVAVLAAMKIELRPLFKSCGLERDASNPKIFRGKTSGVDIVATVMNMGTKAAAAATERVLDAAAVDHLICIGVAGGLGPSVKVRELVVPEVVVDAATGTEYRPAPLPGFTARGKLWTSDDFETDPVVLMPLTEKGVIALDMETAAIGAVCERRGVPWSVVRGLSDHVTDAPVDKAVFALSTPDGGANVKALAKYVLPKPWRLRSLAQMARNSTAAANASAEAACRAVAAL
jgi:adenosylhomocysteine nucleosidase